MPDNAPDPNLCRRYEQMPGVLAVPDSPLLGRRLRHRWGREYEIAGVFVRPQHRQMIIVRRAADGTEQSSAVPDHKIAAYLREWYPG